MALTKDHVFVIGHKNPDTDSICSALSYAYLKNQLTGTDHYLAARAGDLNGETSYVLKRFGMQAPMYVDDATNRLGDIEYEVRDGISREDTLRDAWNTMRAQKVSTLPVVRHGRLEGIITMEDIALSYMETTSRHMLSEAHTRFRMIVETIGGKVVAGNPEAFYTKGKVLVAAADPDYMESCMEAGDLIILSNREEMMRRALDCGAGCLVVSTVEDIAQGWKEKAEEIGCTIICVEKDTYTIARLIEQSMPVSYFMTRNNLVTFRTDQLTEDVRSEMSKHRFKSFPVLDSKGRYKGMVGRRNLILEEKRKVILVDHQESTQAVDGLENANILEVIDHHKIGDIETNGPIFFRNQPLGCTATILTQMFDEEDVEIPPQIAGLLLSAILSDTLMFRSPTCTKTDEKAAYRLAEIAGVDVETHAMEMFKAGSDFAGKTTDEIFYQDFKKFQTGDLNFGIGQVNIMTEEDGVLLKDRILQYLHEKGPSGNYDAIFFMLTNILTESTKLIFVGEHARDYVEEAFDVKADADAVVLDHVLSRKKQLLPPLMRVMSGN